MSGIHIGSTIRIATGAPATFDAVGYEALTWVEITNPVEAPSFGTTNADIPIPNLTTGRTTVCKGAATGQATSLSFSRVIGDAGQDAVRAASLAPEGEYSLSVENAAGTEIEYCTGIVKDYLPNAPTTTSYEGASTQFVPNYDPVLATPP